MDCNYIVSNNIIKFGISSVERYTMLCINISYTYILLIQYMSKATKTATLNENRERESTRKICNENMNNISTGNKLNVLC